MITATVERWAPNRQVLQSWSHVVHVGDLEIDNGPVLSNEKDVYEIGVFNKLIKIARILEYGFL